MSGNPRKFSEKIAIHQRKLNEEQNAFQSIIAEVSSITRSGDPVPPTPWGPGTSGSFFVPGVADANNRYSMGHTRGRSPGPGHGHAHAYHPYRNISPHHNSPTSHSPERPQLTPPYPGAMFLVPPQDTSWRRTHSDPGIHASVMQPPIPGLQPCLRPSGQNTSPTKGNAGDKFHSASGYYLEPKLNPVPYRPRSCENVPNISIQPSEPVTGPQVPISTNTGSLPDLPSSFLPAHAHLQQLEGVLNSHPIPFYGQVSDVDIGGGIAGNHPTPALSTLQQRHSIQLPVHYSQGVFMAAGGGGGGMGGGGSRGTAYSAASIDSMGSQGHTSTFCKEEPRSSPNSPSDRATGSDDSQTSPVTQAQSPGSPYYTLHTKMQNINIDTHEPRSAIDYNALSQNINSFMPSNAYHDYSPQQMASNMEDPYQRQMYQALLLGQQTGQYGGQTSGHHQDNGQRRGQIPDIIFTGADDPNAGGASHNVHTRGGYVDPTMEMISSDLRVSLDPVDLERLHGLNNQESLNIDAASEDALRHDRA